MARSQATVSKKEKENKKLQKKKEKEQRKEARKANSSHGKSFEDMLAYVDEDGNISSTPPDPSKKKNINVEEIVIGAAKHSEERNEIRTGTIKYFNTSKGYGFITDDKTKESIFVHISALSSQINENDKVTFSTETSVKGLVGVDVRKI
jgi:cold shock CspA family protein